MVTAALLHFVVGPGAARPVQTVCNGDSGKFQFRFEGRLYLNQKFVPAEQKDEVIEAAVQNQLRYLQEHATTVAGRRPGALTTSYADPKIRILEVKETSLTIIGYSKM